MHSPLREMILLSKAYCALIESANDGDAGWLPEVAMLLPRLHAATIALGDWPATSGHQLAGSPEQRFELFVRLRVLIGARDSYWLEFDQATDMDAMSGSLADDLTDIYFELKQVLEQLSPYRASVRRAVKDWSVGYRLHWGQHLLDAERHLYSLNARNRLQTSIAGFSGP